nr:MAG: methyltransferase [Sedum sarmentosum crinivirus]UUW20888.1 MAG: methyltransferase [Sedum sarmentosum crinivirus]
MENTQNSPSTSHVNVTSGSLFQQESPRFIKRGRGLQLVPKRFRLEGPLDYSINFQDKKIKSLFRFIRRNKYLKSKKTLKKRLFESYVNMANEKFMNNVEGTPLQSFNKIVNIRMQVLRRLCGIPQANFRKLPVPVFRKYGFDFSKINEAIDEYLNSVVGSSTSSDLPAYERIEGSTVFGDGFLIKFYEELGRYDIFVKFSGYASHGHDFKIRLERQTNRHTKAERIMVYAAKAGLGKEFSFWCDHFVLHSSLTAGQRMVVKLLTSVAERVPDIFPRISRMFSPRFKTEFPRVRDAFIKECARYREYLIKKDAKAKRITLSVKRKSSLVTASVPNVVHHVDKTKGEYFVVKRANGTERVVPNDSNAVRNLFNATLTAGKFNIHPKALVPDSSFFLSKKTEYCWLDAFALANKKIPDFVVPYPSLRMRVLYNCGLQSVLEKHCHFVKRNTYHFDRTKVSKVGVKSLDGFVGAKVDTEIPSLGQNINVIFDDLIGHYIQGTNLRSDNLLHSNIINRLSDRINEMFQKPKELDILTTLNAAEKRKVIDMFPELNLNFLDASYSSHPIATAVRTCENYIMAKKHGFSDFIDVGGDVVSYLKNGVKNVHVCTPVVDAKDSHRHITRSALIDTMWGHRENISFCENQTECCHVEKTNIVAVEVYDMTLQQMAQAILSHKAKRFDFSLVIPPEICDPVCDVYLLNNSLHVTSNGDRVEYVYGNFGESYFHDREALRDILRMQMFVYNGIVFKKTLECSRDHLHFFSLVPCVNIKPGTYVLSTHYKKSESDKIDITIPVREKLGEVIDKRTSVDRAMTYSLIEYVMNTAMRVDDKAAEYLISQFRARKSMTIKGNKVIPQDFDLPIEYVPGYLAIILAEGLRLREKIQYFARISYHRHYSPSIFRIFILIIREFMSCVSSFTYDSFVWVMRKCLSDKLLDKIIYGERRIHDCDYVMNFKQEITILGESGSQRVLGDSIHAFTEVSDKVDKDLTSFLDEKSGLFNDDDFDKLYNYVHSGGGASGGLSKLLKCCSSFHFYSRVYNFIAVFVQDAQKVSTYTNFFVSVVDWLRFHGITCKKFLKEVFNVIMAAITGKLKTSMLSLWEKLKKCARDFKGLLRTSSKSLEDEIEGVFMMDGMIMEDIAADVSNIVKTHQLEQELVNSGGGCRTNCFLVVATRKVTNLIKLLKCYFNELLRQMKLFLRNLPYIPEVFREFFFDLFTKIKIRVLSVDSIELTIQGLSFLFVNTLSGLVLGSYGFCMSLVATLMFVTLKYYGIEKRYLGSSIVNEHLSSAISGGGLFCPALIPVRSLMMKTCQIYLKKNLLNYQLTNGVATELIAKDVTGTWIYSYVTPYRVRLVVYFSLMLAVLNPFYAGMLLVCVLMVGEHVKYYRTVAVRANITLSFASKLRRLNPTSRARELKRLLVSKFDKKALKSRFTTDRVSEVDDFDIQEEHLGGVKSSSLVGGVQNFNDSGEVTELDYSGKEVKSIKLWDDSDEDPLESEPPKKAESLTFSSLDITSNREKFLCDSKLPLSDALLQYPLVDIPVNVPTGDLECDTFNEFFYLEKKKLYVELGKVNNLVDFYKSNLQSKTRFASVVWHLRNRFDDATMYVSENSRTWHRLRQGDKGVHHLESQAKYTCDNRLISFDEYFKGFQVTSEELSGLFSNKRCLALQNITLDPSTDYAANLMERVTFFNKPPGAGKTTTIVQRMASDIQNNVRCMAFTCTNAGKKEIIHKLKEKGVSNAFNFVSTYDSFLINGSRMQVDIVYCDEIFMIHAGLWIAILSMLEFNTIECYGDKNQIPFINRVPNTICHLSQKFFYIFRMFHDNVSYRCPPDVCYILSGLRDATGELLYPNGVKSMGPNSNLLRSMFVVPLQSAEEVGYDPETKMIAFTKPEKDDIMKFGRTADGKTNSAQTVNEVQGGTFKKVELFRLRQYDNPIYNDINQFVVSISRHTEIMKYRVLSTKMFDSVGQQISALDKVADHIIKECAFKQRV